MKTNKLTYLAFIAGWVLLVGALILITNLNNTSNAVETGFNENAKQLDTTIGSDEICMFKWKYGHAADGSSNTMSATVAGDKITVATAQFAAADVTACVATGYCFDDANLGYWTDTTTNFRHGSDGEIEWSINGNGVEFEYYLVTDISGFSFVTQAGGLFKAVGTTIANVLEADVVGIAPSQSVGPVEMATALAATAGKSTAGTAQNADLVRGQSGPETYQSEIQCNKTP
jgi:hypothetical protein